MTDLKTNQPDKAIAPGVGGASSTAAPVGTEPQPKGVEPMENPSGKTDSKDRMGVSTQKT